MTIYPVVHYKTGGMDPFRCVGALCFTRAPVQRRINSRWPYMIFTMQQWWMESLTVKIIAFSLELPEFYVSFFFFLNDCPQRGADCITMPTDPPPQSRCESSFQELRPKQTAEPKRKKWLNLIKMCAFIRYRFHF